MNARTTPRKRTLADRQVFVEVVSGVEGPSLSVGGVDHGERVAGPKPWGGGSTIHSFKVDADNLRRVLNDYVPDTLRAQNAELVKALQDARNCCSDMYAAYHAGTPYHKRMTMQDRLAKIDAALALAKVQKESQP